MKRRLTPLILTAVLIIFATCKKDPEVNIESFEISREVVTPGTTSVSISGIYEYPGKIDAIRLSVGTRIDFKDAKDYLLDLDGNTFNIRVDSLRSSTEYRYRYEVDYGAQEPFITEANTFTTKDVSLPVVSTATVSFIGANDAFCGGDVTDSGGDVITARGVCWSTEVEPTLSCPHTVDSCGIGEFTSHIEGLVTNTRYYVRAYATNSQGTAYGSQLQFTTTAMTPTVITSAVTNITQTSATCGGNVTDDGGSAVTERGICWSTSHNPTTDNTFANSGTGIGSFAVQMSNLVPNYTYYVRAYAKNAQGTSYGAEVSFTALEGLPEVTTSNVTDITATTAKCGGNVTSQGGSTVTERGVCWSTSHNPTTSNSHANGGMGTGSFTCNLTGLTIGTTYYVRAYATNSMGIVYGEEKEFSTAASLPTVITSNITNITQTSAQGGGEVLSDGGTAVTERGICWSTSHNPTTNDPHATNGAGIGGYTISMTGLTANTTYYVRAYASNDAGTAYGSEVSCITLPNNHTEELFTISGVTFKMILVEGDTFWMGAQSDDPNAMNYDPNAYSNESPVHQVTLNNFYMGETEVTQALWQAVMGNNPSHFFGYNLPVETVSWGDCQFFISELNEIFASQLDGRQFALPTEVEWEFAARGGKNTHGYKYSGGNNISGVAWYKDDSGTTTHAVGTKLPNELGLYDLSGNVEEWCNDWYNAYNDGIQTNPLNRSINSDYVCRGGGWNYQAKNCRVSCRNHNAPSNCNYYLGLRLVLHNCL